MVIPPIILKKVDLTGLPAMKKRDLNKCLKEAYRAVGKWWLTHALPDHFKAGAAGRYGFSKRSGRYLRKKKARFHHRQPLIYTGTLQRQVLSPGRQRLMVTKKGVRIKLRHDVRHRKVHQELVSLARDGSDLVAANAVLRSAFAEAIEHYKARRTIRAG